MRATFGIQTRLRQPQPLHRPAANQMFLNDFLDIPCMHKAIPHGLRINHHHRPMLALVQTPGFVDPHAMLQPGSLYRVLQLATQLLGMLMPTTWPRRRFIPLIQANKNMMFKLSHYPSTPHALP